MKTKSKFKKYMNWYRYFNNIFFNIVIIFFNIWFLYKGYFPLIENTPLIIWCFGYIFYFSIKQFADEIKYIYKKIDLY